MARVVLLFAALGIVQQSCGAEALEQQMKSCMIRGMLVQGSDDHSTCLVYTLDLAELAARHKLPSCDPSQFVVDSLTQVPRLLDFVRAHPEYNLKPAPHYLSANSAPYFFGQHLKGSNCHTDSIQNATMVYVDDYCYRMWWISAKHSEADVQRPGETLMQLWGHLLKSALWQEHGGRHFVFFNSHTGFADGILGNYYEDTLCNEFAESMHFINVRAQRYRCKVYDPDNFLIVPGSVHSQEMVEYRERQRKALCHTSGLDFQEAVVNAGRPNLLFFKGKCTPLRFSVGRLKNKINTGKFMRYEINSAVKGMGSEIIAQCTGDGAEMTVASETTHDQQMEYYSQSVFCLMTPGDSQTSRRMPESIMAGCIPVMPGPPFHTLPLYTEVDYTRFALFYNMTDAVWLNETTVHWEVNMSHRAIPSDPEWWVPDLPNIKDVMISVRDPAAMIEHLRALPHGRVLQLQKEVERVKSKFAYMHPARAASRHRTASDVLSDRICRRWMQDDSHPYIAAHPPQGHQVNTIDAWLQPAQSIIRPLDKSYAKLLDDLHVKWSDEIVMSR